MIDQPASRPDWPGVWSDVAQRLAEHRAAGRGQLLTEDTVRMCTVLALQAVGVGPERMAIEVAAPVLAGGKLDLTVDTAAGTVIELKYPRGSRTGVSPDTMTLGELIRDFLRVALVDAQDRWVVQVLGPKLRGYLANVANRHDLRWASQAGDELVITRKTLVGLPKTALDAIGRSRGGCLSSPPAWSPYRWTSTWRCSPTKSTLRQHRARSRPLNAAKSQVLQAQPTVRSRPQVAPARRSSRQSKQWGRGPVGRMPRCRRLSTNCAASGQAMPSRRSAR